ncbi:hypothetical protein CC78DRAFT_188835 [Lojkania enalia]|uniref:Uncharacterized protein n=1 Tax=Lojkania enalia TaxID=147567 RepID=A0A9P4NBA9_9PLEO|nr:hypothetical protein CC78DRAFT_188835 [Didymosphaeria enalia]
MESKTALAVGIGVGFGVWVLVGLVVGLIICRRNSLGKGKIENDTLEEVKEKKEDSKGRDVNEVFKGLERRKLKSKLRKMSGKNYYVENMRSASLATPYLGDSQYEGVIQTGVVNPWDIEYRPNQVIFPHLYSIDAGTDPFPTASESDNGWGDTISQPQFPELEPPANTQESQPRDLEGLEYQIPIIDTPSSPPIGSFDFTPSLKCEECGFGFRTAGMKN